MPLTQTSCPRCRQPVQAEIERLFDLNQDPQAKQKILSRQTNLIQCPSCGFVGQLSVPIVYHDPEKELLLTFFPPDLGVPVNEQERQIGPLIQRVVNNLPPEKRKGYLLRPQTMFTFQLMIEKILEADGITKEMIAEQENRLRLLQKLLSAPPDKRSELIKQEEKSIDENFIAFLNQLIQASAAQQDEQSARYLSALQKQILAETEVGKKIADQIKETQEAMASLRNLSKEGLTREKLLDLFIQAPSETRINVLAQLAYSAMDYLFFQLLSEKIDAAKGKQKEKLELLRTQLLDITQVIQAEIQNQQKLALELLNNIIKAPDVAKATEENLENINQFFLDILNQELEKSRKNGNLDRSVKLNQVLQVIEKASAPPPEAQLIEDMVNAESDTDINHLLEKNSEKITPEFVEMLSGLMNQYDKQDGGEAVAERLKEIYRIVLRFAMRKNLAA